MTLRRLVSASFGFCFIGVAGCAARLLVGEEDVVVEFVEAGVPTSNGSDAAPDASLLDGQMVGSSDGGTRLQIDGGPSSSVTPCSSGPLCWSYPSATGDDFVSVLANADDDVWAGTLTGTIVHYDGKTVQTVYQGEQNSGVRFVSNGPHTVWAFFNVGDSNSESCYGKVWIDGVLDESGDPFCYGSLGTTIRSIAATGTVAPVAGTNQEPEFLTVLTAFTGEVILTDKLTGSGANGNLASTGLALSSGDIVVDTFAAATPTGTTVWTLSDQGRLAMGTAPATSATSTSNAFAMREVPSFVESDSGANTLRGTGLWGFSASDVWAVYEVTAGFQTEEVFRHFDGMTWSTRQELVKPSGSGTYDDPSLAARGSQRIWGAKPTDIWTVLSGSHAAAHGSLAHWDGTSWTIVNDEGANPESALAPFLSGTGTSLFAATTSGRLYKRPSADSSWTMAAGSNPNDEIEALSATAHDDIWALRHNGELDDGKPPPISEDVLHFDGTSWSALPNPNPAPAEFIGGFQAMSDDEVWLFERTLEDDAGTLHRWDGSSWSEPFVGADVTAFWASGPADAWAAAYRTGSTAPAVFLTHWDGHSWTPSSPRFCDVTRIIGTGPNELYILATVPPDGGACPNNWYDQIFHWDGSSSNVQIMNCPTNENPLLTATFVAGHDIWSTFPGSYWDGIACVTPPFAGKFAAGWGLSADDATFVGASSFRGVNGGLANGAQLAHWDGANISQPIAPLLGPPLTAITGAGPGDLWVGGNGGALLRTTMASTPTPVSTRRAPYR